MLKRGYIRKTIALALALVMFALSGCSVRIVRTDDAVPAAEFYGQTPDAGEEQLPPPSDGGPEAG
ncbi:MAG: hypothetical protein J5827_00150, partial [Oscillospiraceae bacterium]|nr:hypothetical protein [Oscillospiraceae bacterium]